MSRGSWTGGLTFKVFIRAVADERFLTHTVYSFDSESLNPPDNSRESGTFHPSFNLFLTRSLTQRFVG